MKMCHCKAAWNLKVRVRPCNALQCKANLELHDLFARHERRKGAIVDKKRDGCHLLRQRGDLVLPTS